MALSYINNKEIKFGSSKPLNGVYTPGSPTREYEPLDSLGIYLNSGIPLSYGVENNRYMSMSDEFAATSQGNSYSFNQLFAAQMMLGFKLHDRFIACDTEHKIIGTEPLLHKAYLAEITEKTLDYFKIKIYEEKTRTFCIRMSSSEVPTSYVDLTNSFDENGLNLTQTDRQSFLSYYRFYPLTARDPSSRNEETLGVDYYLLPSAEGLKELSGDILSKFNAFISSDGSTLTSLGNTAFAYAGDIDYVPNYRSETSEAAVSAAESARVILGRVEEMHADINQILPEMKENLELTKQYRDEAMSTEIGTVRTDLETERNARIEADAALSAKVELASSVNRYEIENLKAKAEGKLYRTETAEAEAYALDVPSSVAPYAELQKIGGKSVVWNQIFKNTTISSQGLTLTNNADCSITINGTSTSSYFNFDSLDSYTNVEGKFLVVFEVLNNPDSISMQFGWLNRNFFTSKNTIGKTYSIFDQTSSSLGKGMNVGIAGISSGTVFNDVKVRMQTINLTRMFGSGNEPTLDECKRIFSDDYYPFDAGTLKSFPVQRVKSVGKNLFEKYTDLGNYKVSSQTYNGYPVIESSKQWGGAIDEKLILKQGETYTISFMAKTSASSRVVIYGNSYIKEFNVSTSWIKCSSKFTPTIDNTNIRVENSTSGTTLYISQFMVEKGSVATDYSPYKESTLDVSSVTSDLKSAGSVHDEWSNGEVTKRIKTYTFTGNENWNVNGSSYQTVKRQGIRRPENWHSKNVVITDANLSTYVSQSTLYNGIDTSGITLGDNGNIVISSSDYANRDTLLTGKTVYFEVDSYEEAVPEISNLIQVEGGGTLTFESDDAVHMPVPSTGRFVVDLTSTTEETT